MRKEVLELQKMIIRCNNLIYLGRLYNSSWGAEFSWKEANVIFDKLDEQTSKIDILSLSNEERDALGFMKFDENNYALPAIFHKAAKKQNVNGGDFDDDTRFGMIWCLTPIKE